MRERIVYKDGREYCACCGSELECFGSPKQVEHTVDCTSVPAIINNPTIHVKEFSSTGWNVEMHTDNLEKLLKELIAAVKER